MSLETGVLEIESQQLDAGSHEAGAGLSSEVTRTEDFLTVRTWHEQVKLAESEQTKL